MSDDEKILIDLRAAHAKRKAQAAHAEIKLKVKERKARTRKLIDAGGLVEKAGLLGLSKNKLYGGLRFMEKHREEHEEAWGVDGGQSFAEDARRREEGQDKLLIIFPAPLPKGAGALLKKAGFRFSKIFQHWEGIGLLPEAERLAAEHGGRVQRVTPSEQVNPSVSEPIIPPIESPAEETPAPLDKAVSEPPAVPVADPQPEAEKAGGGKIKGHTRLNGPRPICGQPPPRKDFLQCFDQIACAHMSGLLVRSHVNAGQDGFRDKSSKQQCGLIERHWVYRSISCRGSIDRTICLSSCKFWHRLSTVTIKLPPVSG